MKGPSLFLTILVVISITVDFGAQGSPRPQNDDDSFTFVDGFAFDGNADRQIPIRPGSTRAPQVGRTAPPTFSTTVSSVPVTAASQAPEVEQCRKNCPATSEYNPVCGTDLQVYTNPGMLSCARACGVNVGHAYFGPCSTNIRG